VASLCALSRDRVATTSSYPSLDARGRPDFNAKALEPRYAWKIGISTQRRKGAKAQKDEDQNLILRFFAPLRLWCVRPSLTWLVNCEVLTM
jgi:hypothetical protein